MEPAVVVHEDLAEQRREEEEDVDDQVDEIELEGHFELVVDQLLD